MTRHTQEECLLVALEGVLFLQILASGGSLLRSFSGIPHFLHYFRSPAVYSYDEWKARCIRPVRRPPPRAGTSLWRMKSKRTLSCPLRLVEVGRHRARAIVCAEGGTTAQPSGECDEIQGG